MADDLIKSMNSAASQAAPKNCWYFYGCYFKMSLTDAQKILNSGENGAKQIISKKNTTDSLKKWLNQLFNLVWKITMLHNITIWQTVLSIKCKTTIK